MIKILKKYLDDDSAEVVSKALSFLVIKILGTVFSFAFTLYVTNIFGKEVWGLFALAISIFTILSIVGALGIDIHFVKYFSQDKNLGDVGIYFRSLIKVFLFSSLLAYLVFFFRKAMVFNLFFEPKPELLLYLKWILPSIPFWSVLILSSGVMRARKMNRSYAFYVMSSRFVVLTMFVFLFSITEIQLILKCYFFSIFFFSIISVIHVFLILKRISFTTQNNTWIFLKQSIPMMLSSSILVFMSWMDTFIMGIFEEESEVGIYNVAVKITTLSVFSLQAINSILAPKIAQAHANNERVVYLNLISFSTKINFYITIVAVSLVMIFHNFLLGLFGEGFEAGFYVLLILCIGQLINSLSGSVGTIMQMIGEQNKYQTFIVIAFIINLGLTVVLTPLFGGTGAATATVISMVFWNITGAVYLKKRENIISYYTFGNRKTH